MAGKRGAGKSVGARYGTLKIFIGVGNLLHRKNLKVFEGRVAGEARRGTCWWEYVWKTEER
jgi:hypothetical protein